MARKRRKKEVTFGARIARSAESQAFRKGIASLQRRFGGDKFRGTRIQELLKVGTQARAESNVTAKQRLLKKERELRRQVERGR